MTTSPKGCPDQLLLARCVTPLSAAIFCSVLWTDLYGLWRTSSTSSDPQNLPAVCYQEPAPLNPSGTEKHRDEDVSATSSPFAP